jgi:lysophospholipase L1-like esterase
MLKVKLISKPSTVGYSTSAFKEILPYLLLDFPPEACKDVTTLIVWLGTNDAALPGTSQCVPLSDYEQNLTHILKLLRSHFTHACNRIVISPGICDPARLQEHDIAAHNNEVMLMYANSSQSIAMQESWDVLHLYNTMIKNPKEDYLCDGLHLSACGNDLVYSTISEILASHDKSLGQGGKFAFPYWRDLPEMHDSMKLKNEISRFFKT